MRAVVQRVSSAAVEAGGETVAEIGAGLCVLLGIAKGDAEDDAARLAGRIARLRIFPNDEGRFDRSVLDTGGVALVVSNFTLLADSRRPRGTRPDFGRAARPAEAEPLYDLVCDELAGHGVHVARGRFGALMDVHLVNDGPVTIVLDI